FLGFVSTTGPLDGTSPIQVQVTTAGADGTIYYQGPQANPKWSSSVKWLDNVDAGVAIGYDASQGTWTYRETGCTGCFLDNGLWVDARAFGLRARAKDAAGNQQSKFKSGALIFESTFTFDNNP